MSGQAPRLSDDTDNRKPKRKRTYQRRSEFGAGPEISGQIDTHEEDPYLNKIRWKNRRQMAWISLFALMAQVTASILIITLTDMSIEKIKVLAELMSWPSVAFASVIGAYMGFTTWAGKKK